MNQTFAPLQWRTEFECGHSTIDHQHRSLFDAVNRMMMAVNEGDLDGATERLDEIVTHVIEHFRDEEAALERCNYPALSDHRQHHMTLLQRALLYRHDVLQGVRRMSDLVTFLIDDVIVDHMLAADRLYYGNIQR